MARKPRTLAPDTVRNSQTERWTGDNTDKNREAHAHPVDTEPNTWFDQALDGYTQYNAPVGEGTARPVNKMRTGRNLTDTEAARRLGIED